MKQESGLLIGVIAAQAADIEQREILHGIITQAQTIPATLAIFSNTYNPNDPDPALDCENRIYELILSHKLDGLVLISEAFLNNEIRQIIHDKLVQCGDLPVVVIGTRLAEFSLPHFTFINTDDLQDMEDITDHLINAHGFTDIDFLTGPASQRVSNLRTEGYCKALEKHQLPFREEKVYYGDFWMHSGHALAKRYLSGELPFPQAVICANDYMAYGLLDEFTANDVPVPERLTVMGYEYIRDRLYHTPLLSTYQRNRSGIGREAIRILHHKIRQKPYTVQTAFPGTVIPGDSCPCGIAKTRFHKELETVRNEQTYSFFHLFGLFEQKLTNCRSIQDYIAVCRDTSYMIRDVDGIYLCLFEDWYDAAPDPRTEMMEFYTIKDSDPTIEKPSIVRKRALAQFFAGFSTPAAYYWNPLFFFDRLFGYIILAYHKPDTHDHIFRNWMKTASNALEMLRIKNDMRYLLQCQNLSASQDTVTGIYNKKGLVNAVSSAVSELQPEDKLGFLLLQTELFSAELHLDKLELKTRLAQEAAGAVKALAKGKQPLCGRIGSNCYVFVSTTVRTERELALLLDKLRTLLVHQPLSMRECGMHAFTCTGKCYAAAEFRFERALQDAMTACKAYTREAAEQQRLPHYASLQNFRNAIYLDPMHCDPLEVMCQKLCFSLGYFRNVYKKCFGISYHHDEIRSRISMGKYLLCTTSLNVTVIAAKCGYEDVKYFMRLFQQHIGYTPTQYRALFHAELPAGKG